MKSRTTSGALINLLNAQPKLYDGPPRDMDPSFGITYFDGTRQQGYGGYHYDGRWIPICKAIVKRYNLNSSSRVLDIGAGKGFFLASLMEVCPGIKVAGVEVSQYGIDHTLPQVKPFIVRGGADDLGFYPDSFFDFVSAMNTLHFLPPDAAERALRELMRVGRDGQYFVQVDAFTNEVERERLLAWAPVIKTVYSVEQWLELFRRVGYDGDYYWTFVRPLNG